MSAIYVSGLTPCTYERILDDPAVYGRRRKQHCVIKSLPRAAQVGCEAVTYPTHTQRERAGVNRNATNSPADNSNTQQVLTCSSWAQPTLIPSLPFHRPGPRPQVEYEPDVMLIQKAQPTVQIIAFPCQASALWPGTVSQGSASTPALPQLPCR